MRLASCVPSCVPKPREPHIPREQLLHKRQLSALGGFDEVAGLPDGGIPGGKDGGYLLLL
jgi:hypothetical protein